MAVTSQSSTPATPDQPQPGSVASPALALEDLVDIARYHPSLETRSKAGKRLVSIHVGNGAVSVLGQMVDYEALPPDVRELALQSIPDVARRAIDESVHYDGVFQLLNCRYFPDSLRQYAEGRASDLARASIDYWVTRGQYSGVYLIMQDIRLPLSVRASAEENYLKSVINARILAMRDDDYESLNRIALDRTVPENYRVEVMEESVTAFLSSIHKTRSGSVREYFKSLLETASCQDKGAPHPTPARLIECVNNNILKIVNAILSDTKHGSYPVSMFIDALRNDRLPQSTRDAIGHEIAENYLKNRSLGGLQQLSETEGISPKIREDAGMKAVQLYAADPYDRGNRSRLLQMAEQPQYPQSVRELASQKLIKAATVLAECL